MKKLNLVWIFSDSVVGHERQSCALAEIISDNHEIIHCGLRQPWLSFAPRILPGFGRNIIWNNNKPDLNQLPDVLVTTGRRMAAIGKYFKRQFNIKHIQILNPKDSPSKYDLIICPEHDQLIGKNIINTKGSLHNFDDQKFKSLRNTWISKINPTKVKVLSIFIGNPAQAFYKEIKALNATIEAHYGNFQLNVIGSRRTPKTVQNNLRLTFNKASRVWFNERDGDNPYLGLISCSDLFMVTADSINMVSEVCATQKPVIVLAKQHVAPKHKKFIDSLSDRVNFLGENNNYVTAPLLNFNQLRKDVLKKILMD